MEPAAKQPEGRGELIHRKISCRAIVHIRADRALDFFYLADRPSAIGLRPSRERPPGAGFARIGGRLSWNNVIRNSSMITNARARSARDPVADLCGGITSPRLL